jgi:hypothetical protein
MHSRGRALLLLAAAAAFATLVISSGAGAATITQTAVVGVFAGSDGIGQDTGLILQAGVPVTMTASGWFNCGGPGCDFDPNGGGLGGGDFLAPGEPSFGLVARVGTSGPWTFIGDGPTQFSGSGELYFAINDNYFPDNYGDGYTVNMSWETPPTVTPTVTGTLGDNGWYTSDVGVSWSVDDPVVSSTGCNPTAITSDIATETLTCAATTAGGTSSQSVTIKRDATPPTVAFSGNAGTYTVAQAVTIGCAATDALSGVASDTCAQNALAGVSAASLGVGAHTITANATDAAGNTTTASTTFTVVATAASLGDLTTSYVDSSAAYQALSPKAKAAVNRLAAAATQAIAAILPKLPPTAKAVLLQVYRGALARLQAQGWLTAAQASTLGSLAAGL